MKFTSPNSPVIFSLVAASVVVANNVHVENRQASSQSQSQSQSQIQTLSSVASGSTPVRSGAAASLTFVLASTNPTAIPLSSITASMSSVPTKPLASTPVAGAQPTAVSGAPALPDISGINPKNYPALDVGPPTDSPEVKQWIDEVANSGIQIPDIPPTSPGGCPANLQAAQDPNRCWWTCSGCTRPTDITVCPEKDTWGLSFDDGPAPYTEDLLEYLGSVNLQATFFAVGSRCITSPSLLQSQYSLGHQLGVHTWSHPPLTTLTNVQVIAELGWTKKVIKDILGVTPNTMRPPYGDIDDRVRAISMAMGLTPIIWTRTKTATFDTDDFNVHSGLTSAEQVLNNWNGILGNASALDSGFIVLEHDLFRETVDIATGYILPDAIAKKLSIKPVITCQNKPMSDAYIETNDNKTNPPPAGAPGSAQATGAASGPKNSGMPSIPFAAPTALVGSAMAFLFAVSLV